MKTSVSWRVAVLLFLTGFIICNADIAPRPGFFIRKTVRITNPNEFPSLKLFGVISRGWMGVPEGPVSAHIIQSDSALPFISKYSGYKIYWTTKSYLDSKGIDSMINCLNSPGVHFLSNACSYDSIVEDSTPVISENDIYTLFARTGDSLALGKTMVTFKYSDSSSLNWQPEPTWPDQYVIINVSDTVNPINAHSLPTPPLCYDVTTKVVIKGGPFTLISDDQVIVDSMILWPTMGMIPPYGFQVMDVHFRGGLCKIYQNNSISTLSLKFLGVLGFGSCTAVEQAEAASPAVVGLTFSRGFINYNLPTPEAVTISICDIMGRQVARLQNSTLLAGWNKVATPNMAGGFYLMTLKSAHYNKVSGMLIIR